jgi:hypothetical protein
MSDMPLGRRRERLKFSSVAMRSPDGAEGGGGEIGLAGPAAIDGGFADAGGDGDVIERHAGVALFGEVAEGDFEDAALGFRIAGTSRGFFRRFCCDHSSMVTIHYDTVQYRNRRRHAHWNSGIGKCGRDAGVAVGGGRAYGDLRVADAGVGGDGFAGFEGGERGAGGDGCGDGGRE